MKKIIALLLAVVIALPCLTVSADAVSYNGDSSIAYSAGADFEEYLVSEMTDFNKSIDATAYMKKNKWDINEARKQVEYVFLNNPQLFYVETDLMFRYTDYSFLLIEVSYSMTKAEYKKAKIKFDAAVNLAVENISEDMSDIQKALVIHDYIAVNCTYDSTITKYSAYDCLVGKSAVCQGYSLAFSYIMKQLGIECSVINSETMNHAWNYVKIDGKCYHVDVTFDDPSYFVGNTAYDTLGNVIHENFMLSDTAIKKTKNKHYGWSIYENYSKATDKTYDNFFWKKVKSQIFAQNSYLYYVVVDENSPGMLDDSTSKKIVTLFKRYDLNTGKTKTLNKISSTWNVWGKSSYYQSAFVRLEYYDGLFYFNTYNRVYSVNKNGKNATVVCRPSTSNGYIYGMTVTSAGKLRIALAKEPQSKMTYKSKQL